MANLAQTTYPPLGEDDERLLIPTRTIDLASFFHLSTSSTSVSSGVTAPIWVMKASFPMQTSKVSVDNDDESGRERTRTPLRPRPVISSLDPAVTSSSEGKEEICSEAKARRAVARGWEDCSSSWRTAERMK